MGRQVCPITCGCQNPETYVQVQSGCPPTCEHKKDYELAVESRECEDSPINSNYWAAYERTLSGIIDSLPDAWRPTIQAILDLIMREGCDVVKRKWHIDGWENLCVVSRGWYFEPLTYACPISC